MFHKQGLSLHPSVRWCPPEEVVETKLDKLVVNVMEIGTWEDVHALLEVVGRERFTAVLDVPPPGAYPGEVPCVLALQTGPSRGCT